MIFTYFQTIWIMTFFEYIKWHVIALRRSSHLLSIFLYFVIGAINTYTSARIGTIENEYLRIPVLALCPFLAILYTGTNLFAWLGSAFPLQFLGVKVSRRRLYLPFYFYCLIAAAILDIVIFSFTNKLNYTFYQHVLYGVGILSSIVTACYVCLWGSISQPMPMSENSFATQSRLVEMKTGLPGIVMLLLALGVIELSFYLLAERFFALWCVLIATGLSVAIAVLVKKIYHLPRVVYNKRFFIYTHITD